MAAARGADALRKRRRAPRVPAPGRSPWRPRAGDGTGLMRNLVALYMPMQRARLISGPCTRVIAKPVQPSRRHCVQAAAALSFRTPPKPSTCSTAKSSRCMPMPATPARTSARGGLSATSRPHCREALLRTGHCRRRSARAHA